MTTKARSDPAPLSKVPRQPMQIWILRIWYIPAAVFTALPSLQVGSSTDCGIEKKQQQNMKWQDLLMDCRTVGVSPRFSNQMQHQRFFKFGHSFLPQDGWDEDMKRGLQECSWFRKTRWQMSLHSEASLRLYTFFLYLYMCECMCVHTYICIYIYAKMYICICIYSICIFVIVNMICICI